MTELNPHHEVTRATREMWHKLCAFVMVKLKIKEVELSIDDLTIPPEGMNITVEEKNGKIHLRLVNDLEAVKLAKKAGGTFNVNDN